MKQQNFRPAQNERLGKQQNKYDSKKLNFLFGRVERAEKGERVENIVGKEENAGYQHFLLFSQCFKKLYFSGPLTGRIV